MVNMTFDETANKYIRKVLILTPNIENILNDIWERGVFYINPLIDYEVSLCGKPIRKAMQLNPSWL